MCTAMFKYGMQDAHSSPNIVHSSSTQHSNMVISRVLLVVVVVAAVHVVTAAPPPVFPVGLQGHGSERCEAPGRQCLHCKTFCDAHATHNGAFCRCFMECLSLFQTSQRVGSREMNAVQLTSVDAQTAMVARLRSRPQMSSFRSNTANYE